MKKFLSITLALAMSISIMSFFSACGNNDANNTTDGITEDKNANDTNVDGLIKDAEDVIEDAKDSLTGKDDKNSGTVDKNNGTADLK